MQIERASRQQMFEHIEKWLNSGLSQKAYCSMNGIVYHSFHYWYKRYKTKHPELEKTSASFIALQMPGSIAVHTELIMPNGKRLVFHQPADVGLLQVLLQ